MYRPSNTWRCPSWRTNVADAAARTATPGRERLPRLLFGTHNPAKVAYYRPVLEEIAVQVVSLRDLGTVEKPRENGATAEANAEIKANFYAALTGLPTFSEDEALYLDFLDEQHQPGPNVRRIDGREEADDDRLLAYWSGVVARVLPPLRTGRWHVACALADGNDELSAFALDFPIRFHSPPSSILIPGWPLGSLQGPIEHDRPWNDLAEDQREESLRKRQERLLAELMRQSAG